MTKQITKRRSIAIHFSPNNIQKIITFNNLKYSLMTLNVTTINYLQRRN